MTRKRSVKYLNKKRYKNKIYSLIDLYRKDFNINSIIKVANYKYIIYKLA